MSNQLMKLVWECDALTDPLDALIMLRLAWLVDDRRDREHCFCRIEELAEMSRYSVRQMERSLKRLEAHGWLRSHRKGGRGRIPDFWLNRVKLETSRMGEKPDTDVVVSEPQNSDTRVAVSVENPDIRDAKPRHLRQETPTSSAENPDIYDTPSNTSRRPSLLPPKKPPFSSQASPELQKSDSRFSPFEQVYCEWFERVNGIKAKFGRKEGEHLRRFLIDYPALSLEMWRQILANREGSPVTLSRGFCDWLPKALCWLRGLADDRGDKPRWVSRGDRVRESIAKGNPSFAVDLKRMLSSAAPTIEGKLASERPSLHITKAQQSSS